MAWIKLGTTTLGSAGDTITVSGMTASKFNMILHHSINNGGGSTRHEWTMDNNSNTDYAFRKSEAGGSDQTSVNATTIQSGRNYSGDDFEIIYSCNIDSEEKLSIHSVTHQQSSGAGTAPNRMELVGKVDTTTNTGQYTRLDLTNTGTGDFDTDSNVSVLGSDGTASLNVQDGAIYYDTDLNKEYVLYNNTWTEV